jgi:membrane-associated phospholipid phosphatase
MYWLPAQLVAQPHRRFEEMLLSMDRRWLAAAGGAGADRIPRLVVEALELSYLLCYPLIPLGIACLYAGGAAAEADRYWTAVLLAGALSYGFLPWLPSRPPRDHETRRPPASVVRDLNMHVVRYAAVGWNTFPSGHVATAFAAALAVAAAVPIAGAMLLWLAVGIAAAASIGRYHYVADIAAGLVVALIAFLISRLASGMSSTVL